MLNQIRDRIGGLISKTYADVYSAIPLLGPYLRPSALERGMLDVTNADVLGHLYFHRYRFEGSAPRHVLDELVESRGDMVCIATRQSLSVYLYKLSLPVACVADVGDVGFWRRLLRVLLPPSV